MTDVRTHSPISAICRIGGGLCGLVLLAFGVATFLVGVPFTGIHGGKVMFLHTNGVLGLLSVVFGLILLGAAMVGGDLSAVVNTGVASLLLLSGLGNLTVIRTDLNFLAFQMGNIIFSFVVGIVLLTCGLYGRTRSGDPTH